MKMPSFIFTDRLGKPCLIFDLGVLGNVYPHWDLSQELERVLDIVEKEIKMTNKRLISYEKSEFRDDETKRFFIQQSSNVILHLKRFKNFLDEGICKNYGSYIEN
jgi:hypothetical protein